MKIDTGKGTPIWLSPRPDNGITIIQGTSRIFASADEIPHLVRAIQEMTDAHAYGT